LVTKMRQALHMRQLPLQRWMPQGLRLTRRRNTKKTKATKKHKKDKKADKDVLEAQPLESSRAKDKSEKKQQKDRKDKKDKLITTGDDAPSVVQLPVIEGSGSSASNSVQTASIPQAVTTNTDRKEKRDKKDKGDKSEKKDKKDKLEKKETKDKKNKEDKRDADDDDNDDDDAAARKMEKKAKKERKKEKKDKKRKGDELVARAIPAADVAADIAVASTVADGAQDKGPDAWFDAFGQEQQGDDHLFGENDRDIFKDVFDEAFKDDDLTAPVSGSARSPRPGSVTPGLGDIPKEALPLVADLPPLRKKRRVNAQPTDIIGEPVQDEKALTEKWTEVMERIKQPKQLSIHEKDSIPYVQSFVKEMIGAAEADEEALREGRPMLQQLEMLERAVTVMTKYAFMEIFVTYDGCRALAMWLKPLPNGELPAVHIRTKVLECMSRLPITKESLGVAKDPPLGQIVAKLSQHPKETVANRKVAAQLVQRWLKQVLVQQAPSSFDLDTLNEEDDQPKQGTLARPPVETAELLQIMEEDSAKRMHPKIPIITGKDYAVMPVPKHQPLRREKRGSDTNRAKLASRLAILARPNKKSWKPYGPECSGQKVNCL